MSLDANTREAVLAHINECREYLGKPTLAEIQPGRRKKACDCPIARSIGYEASTCPQDTYILSTTVKTGYQKYREVMGHTFRHSPAVMEFVGDFDEGMYPELIAPETDEFGRAYS